MHNAFQKKDRLWRIQTRISTTPAPICQDSSNYRPNWQGRLKISADLPEYDNDVILI